MFSQGRIKWGSSKQEWRWDVSPDSQLLRETKTRPTTARPRLSGEVFTTRGEVFSQEVF